jgi:curved DNA-binding protein CbpA
VSGVPEQWRFVSRARLLELLGLQASATRDEIRSRYHELARKFHPDVNASDERSPARFRAIVAAYQQLLAEEADGRPLPGPAPGAPPAVETVHPDDPELVGSRTPSRLQGSGSGLSRRHAEARSRLDLCKRIVQRAQADARDGDAKALAARKRGDDQTARHFERRAEADRSRVYALLGEISQLERELHGLEAGPSGGARASRTARMASESGLDPAERLNRDVQKVHEEELATLKQTYEPGDRRR